MKQIKIIILSLLIGLYFIEIYFFFYSNKINRSNYYLKLKNNNNIYLSYYPRNVIGKNKNFLPLSNFSNSKIIDCYEKKNYFIFESDNYGFNNKNIQWKNENINIILGDEVVLGSCLNKYNFSSLLSRKTSIINLSNRGAGPLTEFAILKEYAPLKNTKNVFWFLNMKNDFLDLENEIRDNILKKYLSKKNFSQNLKYLGDSEKFREVKKSTIEDEINMYKNSRKNRILGIITFNNARYYFKLKNKIVKMHNLDLQKEIKINIYLEIVDNTISYLKENNINLYIVFTPLNIFYSNQKHIINKDMKSQIVNYLVSRNIKYIDLDVEILKKKIDKKNIFISDKPRSSFNETGHKFISDIIFKQLH